MRKQLSESIDVAEVASKPRSASSKPAKFYTIAHVAETLEVADRTVRRWIKDGRLSVLRVGGVVRISDADLKAFLAIHRED